MEGQSAESGGLGHLGPMGESYLEEWDAHFYRKMMMVKMMEVESPKCMADIWQIWIDMADIWQIYGRYMADMDAI